MPERDGTHGHQGADIHRASQKALAQRALAYAGQPGFGYHRQRQRLVQPDRLAELLPVFEILLQLRHQQLILLAAREEEVIQQPAQTFAPLCRGGGAGQAALMVIQTLQQQPQWPDKRSVQAAHFFIRFDTGPGCTCAAGVTEQHAAQAETPAVAVQPSRQAACFTPLLIQSPADARALYPAPQGRQIRLFQGKARTQGGHIQQIQHFADRQATVGQTQQVLQGNQQGLLAPLTLVGEGERDVPRILCGVLTEYRLHMGRVGVHVRHHDDHVPRPQRRIIVKGVQQLVMQYFHLTLRAVGNMKAQRGIRLGGRRRPELPGFGQRTQREDVLLQLLQ